MIHNPIIWKSVVVWGKAKELSGEAEANAAQIILKRYAAAEEKQGAFSLIRWGQDPSQHANVAYLEIEIDRMSSRFSE